MLISLETSKYWPGLIILVLILYYAIPLVVQRRRYVKLIDKLPGERTLPIIGNALDLIFAPANLITDVIRKNISYFPIASIVRLWIFYKPFIIILKAEAAEVILNNSRNIRKSDTYKILHPWLGQGLLTSDNPRWKAHRRLLTPSFHFRILEQFIPIFNEQSDILLKILEKYKEKEHFDMYQHITLCTLDVICEAAMGKRLQAQTNSQSKYFEYIKAIDDFKKISAQMIVKPWLQIPWIQKLLPISKKLDECIETLHNFTEKVIKERKQLYHTEKAKKSEINDDEVYGQKTRLAFLDTLLEAMDKGEGHLTNEEIREEVDTFMFEGHDTTATAITFVLFILGWCPRAQDKVYEELGQILGPRKNVTIEDIPNLKYLGAVIKESLRLAPSVPMFARQLTEDINIDGYKVPLGTEVFVSPYHVQRDLDVYPSPLEFVPERFLSEAWQIRHPYAYIPFSAGTRNCIGQRFAQFEEKVLLAKILSNYKILPCQILDEGALSGTLVITPTNGLKMALQRRQL